MAPGMLPWEAWFPRISVPDPTLTLSRGRMTQHFLLFLLLLRPTPEALARLTNVKTGLFFWPLVYFRSIQQKAVS